MFSVLLRLLWIDVLLGVSCSVWWKVLIVLLWCCSVVYVLLRL